jgi:hypothetical protein
MSDGSDWCELDSHADTSVAGSNFVVLFETDQLVNVHSFSAEQAPLKSIKIGTAATAFIDLKSGETFILILNQALLMTDRLKSSLLCPNQLRAYGHTVHDTPRLYDETSSHSIHLLDDELILPLELRGVISGFQTRRPTDDELLSCRRLTLTSDTPWNPYDSTFSAQEEALSLRISALHRNGDTMAQQPFSILPAPAELEFTDISFANELSINAVTTGETSSTITKEVLAQRWGISSETAAKTLRVTTQRGIRTFIHPTDRRFGTSKPHLTYPFMRNKRFYTDTMFSKIPSIRKNTCAQVWTDGSGFSLFYPMQTKGMAYQTVERMTQDIQGIPEMIISDGAGEQGGKLWNKEVNKVRTRHHYTEPYSPWQNKAESEIREIKRAIRRETARSKSPKRLWDYCGQRVAAIRCFTAHSFPELDGMTPYEKLYARTGDISAYAQFDWYQYVWYIDPPSDAAQTRRKLGRWIGVAENFGTALTYFILPKSGTVVARSSVTPVTMEELMSDEVKQLCNDLDESINQRIGDDRTNDEVIADFPNVPQIPDDIFVDDENDFDPVDPSELPEADEMPSPDAYDQYLTANVLIGRAGEMQRGTVKARAKDPDGNPVGKSNQNPLLDTREYLIEFNDGSIDVLTANAIAESMYAQVDAEGRAYSLLDQIIEHKSDGNALSKDDAYLPGTRQLRRTTKGWKLLVNWKDGSQNWLDLKDVKESFPVQLAEYAVNNKIAEEPAFAWWVPYTLKKRDRIIKAVKSRYYHTTHKFGIEIPRTIKEALEIDRKTNTTFWRDAIEKEMRNVNSAFDIRDLETGPIGYKEIKCHMIFDVKAETLVRKARFVAGGHMTDPPKESVYSSVVSRDSVRLFFLVAALNDLDISSCDIQNAYINAPTKEKVWFRAGDELGSNKGKVVVIVRALYGLKSSGARFREHLAQTLRDAGFKSCKADPDVWLRAAQKPDGTEIYEYVLCYVDDILYGGSDSGAFMDRLRTIYTLKEGSVKKPDLYLGASIKTVTMQDGNHAYALSSDAYVARAIVEVQRQLIDLKPGMQLKRVSTPMATGYRPELDSTPELNPQMASYYMSLMGILRWAIELGRVDIMVEAGLLSRFQAAPREGHLEQLIHVFAYLKCYSRSSMVFDWTYPVFDTSKFSVCDWAEYYPDAKEPIPTNMPAPRGKPVTTTCWVDADHAGCRLTRRSHTGVIIFVNRAPILWFSKRQATVESSTFGSETVAMRQAVDMIEGLRYKLRMMGIPVEEPTNIYCDNETVVKVTTRPESTLKKKHNAINYHRVREAVAAGFIRIAWVPTNENLADLLTKTLVGEKRKYFLRRILW